MTCSRVFYGLLAALFAYVTVTVAAFRYLLWWQAILASAATLGLMALLARYLVRRVVGNLGEMAKGLFDQKSRVLRNAGVDVHSVRPAAMPADLARPLDDPDADEFDRAEAAAGLATLRWYEVEATIFPDAAQAGAMHHWDLDDLRLVPADAAPPGVGDDADAAADFGLHDLRVVEDGEAVEPDSSKPHGPRRLRFTVGLPTAVKVAKFQYYFEQFGEVRLPAGPALPAGGRA